MTELPEPIKHLYPPRGPGESLPLYEGPVTLAFRTGVTSGDGIVFCAWQPSPHVRWEAVCDQLPVPDPLPNPFVLAAEDFLDSKIRLPNTDLVPGAPSSIATLASSMWNSEGWLGLQVLGTQDETTDVATTVTFLIPNLPRQLPASPVRAGTRTYAARTEWRAGDWIVEIEASRNIDDITSSLRRNGGHAATHTGRLARLDGSSFSRAEASRVLEAIRATLTLAIGRRTAPLLPVGLDASENPVWTEWAPLVVDPWTGSPSMLSSGFPEQLPELFQRITQAFVDPIEQAIITRSVFYFVEANDPSPIDMAVVAAQAGLELLAYSALVESGQITSPEYRKLNADEAMRRLLSQSSIDVALPANLSELPRVLTTLDANGGTTSKDGPEVLARMRNGVIHPSRKKPTFTTAEWIDAWRLSQHYLQLAILARLGYTGMHRDPISDVRLEGSADPVPWTSSTITT